MIIKTDKIIMWYMHSLNTNMNEIKGDIYDCITKSAYKTRIYNLYQSIKNVDLQAEDKYLIKRKIGVMY